MRTILLSAALLTAGVVHAQTTSYTLADVAKHATAADCWMVLNATKVYNFTPFVSMHPGGSTMVPYCGKNGDPGFASVNHSSNAVALETTYLIGALAAAPAPIPGEVAAREGGEVRLPEPIRIAVHGAHDAGPGPRDAEIAGAGPLEHLPLIVHHRGLDPEERQRR